MHDAQPKGAQREVCVFAICPCDLIYMYGGTEVQRHSSYRHFPYSPAYATLHKRKGPTPCWHVSPLLLLALLAWTSTPSTEKTCSKPMYLWFLSGAC